MTTRDIDGRAAIAGVLAALAVAAAIALGSHGLQRFDPALTGYAIGSMLAASAVGYRFTLWAQRPPSRMYFKRGFQLMFRRVASSTQPETLPTRGAMLFPHGAGTLGLTLARNFVVQDFIRRRGGYRWIMHLCLSGGCTLAFLITFPLVFGWVHFESIAHDAALYQLNVLGVGVDQFSIHSVKGLLAFNLLNIAAILVLIGLTMAGYRRLTDPAERATQTFFEDVLPLLLILAVCVTGLALTVSYKFLAGRGHGLAALIHMASVVALLLYIPYGKLFHMFQRSCALAVCRYKKFEATGLRARCRGCGNDFASQLRVNDLKTVLDQLGFDYQFATVRGRIHYQEICPACRRRLLALNQGKTLGR